ncbi:flagellar hook protein FlgE [Granulicella sp. L60]|jgi:flagellar hook protein FlgE|uniref:flagellar hook protein FlgE n=1 Tax=Granulicella sp. L60 TaxID=1641866 RepID=UPI00131B287C|nr:flagellar hook protein FlgE [Granulicella sp. L60]
MGNFSIALSGLDADSVALNTIGNNLANLNTTAFKGQTTSFEDLFYQQIGQSGSGDAIQVGAGTQVSGTSTDFSEGTILPDANPNSSDMALQGNGFFVVQQGGVQSLTRAGNFELSSNGDLITQDGQQVMGYAAVNGVVNQNTSLAPITIPVGVNEGAQATQNFSVTANLNSNATVGTAFSSPVQVYDSLGQSHQATVNYTKTGTNTWSYSVTLPAGDATGTPTNNTGTLTFDSSGNLVSPTGSVSNITFPGLADGASDLSFNWNLNGSSGSPTVTQLASASTNTAAPQDGFTSGVYQSFTVDPSGVITAQFSNGRTSTIGQVAVATVANTAGLTASGGNNFNTTAASGQATIGVAGAGGRGTIDDGALEQSNVNISTEFSNLIVAQRAFEANSKTVTTFDTVSQDVLAMVR